jgi:hypothetical protein
MKRTRVLRQFLSTSRSRTRAKCLRSVTAVACACATIPALAAPTVVEYFNRDLDNFFITADPVEQASVDSGAVGRWQRTGNTFAAGGPNQVCRFYGNGAINPATGSIYGPNSHFYTANPVECAGLKAQFAPNAKSWKFESNDFLTTPPAGSTCANGLVPVYRAYNNGFARGIDSNHRITSNLASYQATLAAGWVGEGVVMCAPAGSPTNPPLLLSLDGTTVYDAANNVSWLADFNLPASNRFGLPLCSSAGTDPKSCINASGSMSYQAAAAWVTAMNAANYLGHSNWQLPTTPSVDPNCPFSGQHGNSFAFDCSSSAFGSLYYSALGLKAPNTAVPIPDTQAGAFHNFQPYIYWSQTPGAGQSAGGGGYATFSFANGFQGANTEFNFMYALPMVPGKIPGTPVAVGNGLQVNPGGQTIYDPMTNITWLANANLAATDTFGLPTCADQNTPRICVGKDGAMSWNSTAQWIANMNAAAYLGQTNWQLPPLAATCPNYGCDGSQNPMGTLYYDQLGLARGTPVVATPDVDVGPFNRMQPYLYWACEGATVQSPCQADGPAPGFEWSFSFGNGFQGTDILGNDLYVTAYYVGPPTH